MQFKLYRIIAFILTLVILTSQFPTFPVSAAINTVTEIDLEMSMRNESDSTSLPTYKTFNSKLKTLTGTSIGYIDENLSGSFHEQGRTLVSGAINGQNYKLELGNVGNSADNIKYIVIDNTLKAYLGVEVNIGASSSGLRSVIAVDSLTKVEVVDTTLSLTFKVEESNEITMTVDLNLLIASGMTSSFYEGLIKTIEGKASNLTITPENVTSILTNSNDIIYIDTNETKLINLIKAIGIVSELQSAKTTGQKILGYFSSGLNDINSSDFSAFYNALRGNGIDVLVEAETHLGMTIPTDAPNSTDVINWSRYNPSAIAGYNITGLDDFIENYSFDAFLSLMDDLFGVMQDSERLDTLIADFNNTNNSEYLRLASVYQIIVLTTESNLNSTLSSTGILNYLSSKMSSIQQEYIMGSNTPLLIDSSNKLKALEVIMKLLEYEISVVNRDPQWTGGEQPSLSNQVLISLSDIYYATAMSFTLAREGELNNIYSFGSAESLNNLDNMNDLQREINSKLYKQYKEEELVRDDNHVMALTKANEADTYLISGSSNSFNNRLYSLRYRIQLTYFATLAGLDLDSIGMGDVKALSSQEYTEGEADGTSINDNYGNLSQVFMGTLKSPESYTLLLNNLNELQGTKGFFYDVYKDIGESPSEEELAEIKANAKTMGYLSYFNEIKGAVDFLISRNLSEEYPYISEGGNERIAHTANNPALMKTLREIAEAFWFDEVDNSGISLNDLYVRLLDAGLDLNTLSMFDQMSEEEPLRAFFNFEDLALNKHLKYGISQSATYIPLRTNVYDPYIYSTLLESDFLDFHYKYGFLRKALMIDTNSQSAVDLQNTGNRGALRVVTLRDLLNNNKSDRVLYVDKNFYNITNLADLQGKAFNRVDNSDTGEEIETSTSWWAKMWNNVTDFFTLDLIEICKTAEKDRYTSKLSGIATYSETKNENYISRFEDNKLRAKESAVLPGLLIDENIEWDSTKITGADEYNVLQPFAFTSAVYRSKKLFDFMKVLPNREPVFIASQNLGNKESEKNIYKNAILNYALMKNLSSQRTLSYETNLDLDNPLYLDIYGNILTESGLVVIPVAANATLNPTYSILTTAFLQTYGRDYYIPKDYKLSNSPSLKFLSVNSDEERYELDEKVINAKIDLNRISLSDQTVMDEIKGLWLSQLEKSEENTAYFDYKRYIKHVFMEVVRGAPIEYIDKDAEGINPARKASISGIVAAVKLDQIRDSLGSSEPANFLSLPNPAYIEGLEYIILFTYKLLIACTLILIIVQIFFLAMQRKTFFQFMFYIAATIVAMTSMILVTPKIFEISYHQANKSLLQKEMNTIAMYNLEKREQGIELGMIDIYQPSEGTSLLLKIKNITVPWYSLFRNIVFGNIGDSLNEIYKRYTETDLASVKEDFDIMNGAIYIDLYTMLEKSRVDLYPLYHIIDHKAEGETPAEFYIPYYTFLESLVTNVNIYNDQTNTKAYTTSLYQGGKLKSVGLIENYLTSDKFLTKNDIGDFLNLRQIYGYEASGDTYTPFSEEDYEIMRKSYWFNDNIENLEDVDSRIGLVETFASNYVKLNRHLIGRVSDETFLRIMSLNVAMYYNKVFNIDSCQQFELYKISTDDLLRMFVAPQQTVMEGAPYSFSRYIYSVSGQGGVYLGAIYDAILYLGNMLIDLSIYIIYLGIFLSLYIWKLIFNKEEKSIQGYVALMIMTAGLNFLRALAIKFLIHLPSLGFKPLLCMIIGIIVFLLLIDFYVQLVIFIIKNWKDLGESKVREILSNTIQQVKLVSIGTGLSKLETIETDNSKQDENTGWDTYEALKKSDENREKSYGSASIRKDPFGRNTKVTEDYEDN